MSLYLFLIFLIPASAGIGLYVFSYFRKRHYLNKARENLTEARKEDDITPLSVFIVRYALDLADATPEDIGSSEAELTAIEQRAEARAIARAGHDKQQS